MTVPTIWLVMIFAAEVVIAWCWGFMWVWRHWVEPALTRWMERRQGWIDERGRKGARTNGRG